ncbi:MAG: hypothetical protein ABIL37_01285 [candidate division WOR-3 bacterium]
MIKMKGKNIFFFILLFLFLTSSISFSKEQWNHPIKPSIENNNIITFNYGNDVIKIKFDVKNAVIDFKKSSLMKDKASIDSDLIRIELIPVPFSNKLKFNIISLTERDLEVKLTILGKYNNEKSLSNGKTKEGKLTLDLSDIPLDRNNKFILKAYEVIDPFVYYDEELGTWVFNNEEDFNPRVVSLCGKVSLNGQTWKDSLEYFEIRTHPSFRIQNDRYVWEMYAQSNGSYAIMEFCIPDSYAGLSIEEWNGTAWVIRDGASNYTLSVPYLYNSTSQPERDWGTLNTLTPSGTFGTLKRVQLIINTTSSSVLLRISIHFTSIPSISFDGVNDYVVIGLQPDGSGTPFTVYGWSEITIEELIYSIHPKANYALSKTSMIGDHWIDRVATYYNTEGRHDYTWMIVEMQTKRSDGSTGWYPTSVYAYRNSWVHVVRRFTDSRELSYWINGLRVYYTTIPSNEYTIFEWNPDNNATYPERYKRFVLGASVVFSEWMTIKYSYIRIYNRALSNQEILNNLNGIINTTGLVVYINASSWNGSVFVDWSGNNNHGVPYGNVQYKIWNENGFKVTYVGDISDPSFCTYVYGAFLHYGSGSVNIAPKVTANATFSWIHPIFGSNGTFYITGIGSKIMKVRVNGTEILSTVIPLQYLQGDSYIVIAERGDGKRNCPMLIYQEGGDLLDVTYKKEQDVGIAYFIVRTNGTGEGQIKIDFDKPPRMVIVNGVPVKWYFENGILTINYVHNSIATIEVSYLLFPIASILTAITLLSFISIIFSMGIIFLLLRNEGLAFEYIIPIIVIAVSVVLIMFILQAFALI